MEIKKLEQSELNELSQLNGYNQELIIKFGEIEYQIQLLSVQKQELIEKMKEIKIEELSLFNKLETKYGKVNINLESGEITSIN